MARQAFDDGSTRSDGEVYNLDSPASYGGSLGTFKRHADDATGTSYAEQIGGTPAEQDEQRFQGIGEQMQKRDPYKFDWSQADQDHANGAQAGAMQGDANNVWSGQATGQDRQAYNYGRGLLQKGAQNQQAAALSTSGGPLAQVGAAAKAANAAPAAMQKGTNELEAQHADDMATGRAGLSAGLGQQRKQDQAGQGLSDQQTELEAQAAQQQRQLNDAGQYGMDQNKIQVERDEVTANNHAAVTAKQTRDAQTAANNATTQRQIGYVNTAIGAVPMVGKGIAAAGDAGTDSGNPDPTSDERAKVKQPGALVGMMGPWSTWGNKTSEQANRDRAIQEAREDMSHDNVVRARSDALAQAREDVRGTYSAGPGRAPKGYAKSRHGQAGAIDGSGPKASYDLGFGAGPSEGAPGTHDALRYGDKETSRLSKPDVKLDDADKYTKAVMVSDERAKETPEQKKAREDKEDAEETEKFMKAPEGTIKFKAPVGYEERSKAIDEKNAQDKKTAEDAQHKVEREKAQYVDDEDAAYFKKKNGALLAPSYVVRKNNEELARRRALPDAERAKDADRYKAGADETRRLNQQRLQQDNDIQSRFHNAVSAVPGASAVMKYGEEHIPGGAPPPRPKLRRNESTSDSYGGTEMKYGESVSDEEAKDKIDYANPKEIKPLSDDADGTHRGWESDVAPPAQPMGPLERSSKEAEGKQSSSPKPVPTAMKPAPGSRKTRKMTNAELERYARELQNSTDTQSDALLGGGASVSDEKAKDKQTDGYAKDKGAGGGETESGGTTMEHRGPSLSEDPASQKKSNPLIEMQKHANRQLRGETYSYKEGFGEDPNQMHHGFMAQNLETNPITATAVREDASGLKKVDNEDVMRVTAAGVASLQEQHDELEAAMEAMAARRGRKRSA